MYLSAPYLVYPRKPYTLSDDMEAFIHIITVLSLRFCCHQHSAQLNPDVPYDFTINVMENQGNTRLANIRANYLERHVMERAVAVGGVMKLITLKSGSPGFLFREDNQHFAIQSLVRNAYKRLQPFYAAMVDEEWEAAYGLSHPKKLQGPYLVQNRRGEWVPSRHSVQVAGDGAAPGASTSGQSTSSLHVLDGINHALLKEIFDSVPDEFAPASEKTIDQFIDLPTSDGAKYTRSRTGEGGKREGALDGRADTKRRKGGSRGAQGAGQAGFVQGSSRDGAE